MNEKFKTLFSFVTRFGLSLFLLWLIFHFQKIDPQKILNALKSANVNYVVIAGIIFFGAMCEGRSNPGPALSW